MIGLTFLRRSIAAGVYSLLIDGENRRSTQKKRRKNTKKHIYFEKNGNIKKKKEEIHNQHRVTWGFFMYEERRKRK